MADDVAEPVCLAIHGHFYQPPRENPWTEEVPREASAAPFHDWNARVALEAYRPNAFARIVDERGRVVAIVNNYEHLSFDVGPTLSAWLAEHEPEAYQRMLDGDIAGRGAIAQTYFHVILPLATERDVRTHIRWGLTEFEYRFGRRAEGMWLPETAVNDEVLTALVEEDIRFTILAPTQADGPIDPRRCYRWPHPSGDGRGLDIVFYDGGLSHAIAFELGTVSSEDFLERVAAVGHDGGLVAVAADGETFGHHHQWGDRFLAYTLAVGAPKRGIGVTTIAAHLSDNPPTEDVDVVESAWSCAHGVDRWRVDCGCSTGGQPGWNQQWREPLRRALDVVRDAVDGVFERRAPHVLRDPWRARDDYVKVLLGIVTKDEFAAEHVIADPVAAFTLLEAERHQLAMYTSCGWFFNDLAGLETVQVMRYAARALDCLDELGEPSPLGAVLAVLDEAQSNVTAEGTGRDVWHRYVDRARVDASRTVAHLALVELLEEREPAPRVANFDIEVRDHGRRHRGPLALCWGDVVLVHRRTGRRTDHVYAALHLGGLEVLGATRAPEPGRDEEALAALLASFTHDAPVTTLLRQVSDGFGPHEFGLSSALPDAAEQILRGRVRELADRFASAYDRLFADHRPTLTALSAAGYELPRELRAPAELALAHQLELEIAAQAGSLDPRDYEGAIAIAREAKASGFTLDTPRARTTIERLLVSAVEWALRDPAGIDSAVAALDVSRELGLHPSIERAQELVYTALVGGAGPSDEGLRRLAAALNLAV